MVWAGQSGRYNISYLTKLRFLNFDPCHSPLVATQVCRESRNAARRAGFFVLPAVITEYKESQMDKHRVAWFGGPTDVLYHTRSDGTVLVGQEIWKNRKDICLPNSKRVRNAGVSRVSLLDKYPDLRMPVVDAESWRKRVLALYGFSPCLRTVYVVMPAPGSNNVLLEAPKWQVRRNDTLAPLAPSTVIPASAYPPR